jgi:protein N-terminal amidase
MAASRTSSAQIVPSYTGQMARASDIIASPISFIWTRRGRSQVSLNDQTLPPPFVLVLTSDICGGTGFATFHLPPPLNTVTLGICMDLNPRSPWTVEGGPYELADHCLETGSSLLILLNAWLDSETEEDREEDLSTMNDWATMLRPLWYRKVREPNDEGPGLKKAPEDVETMVVVCNRSGIENGKRSNNLKFSGTCGVSYPFIGAKFAGSSSLFRLRQSAGRPWLLENMSRRQEGVCVWST